MRSVLIRRKVALLLAVSGFMAFCLTLYNISINAMVTTGQPQQGLQESKLKIQGKRTNHVINKVRKGDEERRVIYQNVTSSVMSSHEGSPRLYPNIREDMLENCQSNNQDCSSFRKLLLQWPQDKPKAVFYILTQRNRLSKLKRALESIDKHYNTLYHYPVIIFHEQDLVPLIPKIRTFCNSVLYFQEISFNMPDFLPKPVPENISCFSTIGYRHMCRFHAKTVYEQPIMKGIDYYWRLDDDSVILRDVKYDVFKYMRDNAFQYGYSWLHVDSMSCTEGLWDAAEEFIKTKQMKTEFFKEWHQPYIYYNNFEIGRMSIWMSREYAEYIDFVDKKGGIFYHRWGDAPIKGIAVAMFVPKNKTHHFKDIAYQHGSYVNNLQDAKQHKHL